jgi:hypothetical protein
MFKEMIDLAPQISGVPLTLQGVHEGSIDSGKAVQAISDMGVNSLARVVAHYREARRKVGEILLEYIIQDIGDQLTHLKGENKRGRPVSVMVNGIKQDESGNQYIDNNLSAMKLNVVLDDLPHSATHRSEQFAALMQALSSMPPQVQMVMYPAMIEMSELPAHEKQEAADLMRKQMGMGGGDDSPEAQAAAQQAQQEQQQALAKKQQDLELQAEQSHQLALAQGAAKAHRDAAGAQQALAAAEREKAAAARDYAAAHKTVVEAQLLAEGGAPASTTGTV